MATEEVLKEARLQFSNDKAPDITRKTIIIVFLLSIILLGAAIIAIFNFRKIEKASYNNQKVVSNKILESLEIMPFTERIPGSKFHGPDATWWGYNQSKIVRFGKYVFSYVVENSDDESSTTSDFVIYRKEGNKEWEKGAAFKTSRPGNILIDRSGILHVFIFEPYNALKNDSWGKLYHYFFPNSAKGDISNFKKELVIDNNGTIETVNIRIGAAISQDDTMGISFGLTTNNPLYKGHSLHLYAKKIRDVTWTHHIAGQNLGHDWYYPFVFLGRDNFYLFPVQDDYNGPGTSASPYQNIYQKIMFFEYQNNTWDKKLIADLSTHALAKTRPRLLEQEELMEDRNGKVHLIYKEFLDKDTAFTVTSHKHVVKDKDGFKSSVITVCGNNINWVRLFEVNGELFYFCSSWENAYIARVNGTRSTKVILPKNAKGFYPYIAARTGGTKDSEPFIDILLLAADGKLFKENAAINYYIRLDKSELEKIK